MSTFGISATVAQLADRARFSPSERDTIRFAYQMGHYNAHHGYSVTAEPGLVGEAQRLGWWDWQHAHGLQAQPMREPRMEPEVAERAKR